MPSPGFTLWMLWLRFCSNFCDVEASNPGLAKRLIWLPLIASLRLPPLPNGFPIYQYIIPLPREPVCLPCAPCCLAPANQCMPFCKSPSPCGGLVARPCAYLGHHSLMIINLCKEAVEGHRPILLSCVDGRSPTVKRA